MMRCNSVYGARTAGALRASCRWGRYVTGLPAVAAGLAAALVEASRAVGRSEPHSRGRNRFQIKAQASPNQIANLSGLLLGCIEVDFAS